MQIILNKDDLDFALKQALKGKLSLKVKEFHRDEIELNLSFPKAAVIRLSSVVISAGYVSAEMNPGWIRTLAAMAIKKMDDKLVRINGNRIFFKLPTQVTEKFNISSLVIKNDGIHIIGKML